MSVGAPTPPATGPANDPRTSADRTAPSGRSPSASLRGALVAVYELMAFIITGLEAILQLFVGRIPRLRSPPPLPPAKHRQRGNRRRIAPFPTND